MSEQDPEPQQYNMDYCMYCWREAETTTKENPDEGKIPVCAFHMLGFAAEKSEDTFAEKMGYDSAEEIRRKVENQEILLVNSKSIRSAPQLWKLSISTPQLDFRVFFKS